MERLCLDHIVLTRLWVLASHSYALSLLSLHLTLDLSLPLVSLRDPLESPACLYWKSW